MSQPDRSTARRLAAESLAQGDRHRLVRQALRSSRGRRLAHPLGRSLRQSRIWPPGWRDAAAARPWADARWSSAVDWGTTPRRSPRSVIASPRLTSRAPRWTGAGNDFPQSRVDYCVADLLKLPEAWTAAFDFVVEIYTLQVLPVELRPAAMAQLARAVAPGGTLLVVARGRGAEEDRGTMPWPLERDETRSVPSTRLADASRSKIFSTTKLRPCGVSALSCRRADVTRRRSESWSCGDFVVRDTRRAALNSALRADWLRRSSRRVDLFPVFPVRFLPFPFARFRVSSA